ncbi:MAG: hypothetical protein Q8R13_03610 [bacterium]|nr:hypothetical protein [bacterium]MDZ4296433.1 hypothetical protein [Patescibacteria group bacterium]
MRSLVRFAAVPLAIVVLGGAVGYSLGKRAQTAASEGLLNEVFADIRPGLFSGKIAEISPDKKQLTVTVEGVGGVRLPNIYQQKQFTISPDTKILARQAKDTKTFEQEFELLKARSTGPIPPPLPYTEREIGISELRLGETVTVLVAPAAGETVLDGAFVAAQVNVQR